MAGDGIVTIGAEKFEYVLLYEKLDDLKLLPRTKPNEWVYEGIAAKFDIENENHRIYTKAEYLPHLSYLNEKISRRKLAGELDHPQTFDFSLRNISHLVEKLWYDDSDNTVKIRIRLVDTPSGNIAMRLAESGFPLAISSRAAGQVLENKTVKLHRIFTFDLVAEPGFAQAMLSKITNESMSSNFTMINEGLNALKQTSLINQLKDISEGLTLPENVRAYKINKENMGVFEAVLNELTLENNSSKMAFVTTEQFDTYSTSIKGRFDELNTKLGNAIGLLEKAMKINEEEDEGITDAPKDDAAMDTPGSDLPVETGEATTTLDDLSKDDSQTTIIQKLVAYVNYLAKQIKTLVGHGNYTTEMLNKAIGFSEKIGEATNTLINFTNYQAQKQNETANYANTVGELLNKGLNHQDYMSEQVNILANHNDHLAEKINQIIDFSDYHSNLLEKSIGYTSYMGAVLKNSNALQGIVDVKRDLGKNVESLKESKTEITAVSISEEVKSFIAEVKSKSQESVLENRYPFLKLLEEEQKEAFYKLDNDTKSEIVGTLNAGVWFTGKDVVSIMEAVIVNKNKAIPTYLKYMPDDCKLVYQQMNENEKAHIATQASLHRLVTPYHVATFWHSLDLNGVNERIISEKRINEAAKTAALNESQSKEGFVPASTLETVKRGYSSTYLESVKRQAQIRK